MWWYDEIVVHKRQIIPPLILHMPDGRTVRAWDFKQKKNLVIAFLDLDCALCEEFLRALATRAEDLREKEAVALAAFLGPPERVAHSLPGEIIAGADFSGRGAREYLGEDVFASRGLARTGAFVADRYGELFAQWVSTSHKFPPIAEVVSWLDHIGMACDECSFPEWPADT